MLSVRPGVCPYVSDPERCPAEMTQQSCSQDSDCPESSKCCDCGCVRRCTRVSSGEPGTNNQFIGFRQKNGFMPLQKLAEACLVAINVVTGNNRRGGAV